MITKAIVDSKVEGTNKYRVRIPLFENVSSNIGGSYKGSLQEATVCTLPNVSNIVNPGDVVFVSFEENDFGKPIILGHLYQELSKTNTCIDLQVRTLLVKDKKNEAASYAELPKNTKVSSFTANDMEKLILYFKNNNT